MSQQEPMMFPEEKKNLVGRQNNRDLLQQYILSPKILIQVKEEKEAERKRKIKGKFFLWDHENKSLFVWKEFSFHCLLLENLF